ncbi:MAG: class I SAM-dependent methyltransferase [Pseudomonadota bacterium]
MLGDPLETPWTDRIRRGETPSPDELADHLLEMHRRNAGFTEEVAGRSRDADGRTSYEWLAEVVDPAVHRRVLDLGCGSGVLLQHCAQTFGDVVELSGIDLSADELALARERTAEFDIDLHRGRAQDLHMFETESVDVVLCHWALTLMSPLGEVVDEVLRVLKPGGLFAAIVDGDSGRSSVYTRVDEVIFEHVNRRYPHYDGVAMGDAAARSARGLTAVMADRAPGSEVEITPSLVALRGPATKLARYAAGFYYAAYVLTNEQATLMLKDVETAIDDCSAGGNACFEMPIRRLVVKKSDC